MQPHQSLDFRCTIWKGSGQISCSVRKTGKSGGERLVWDNLLCKCPGLCTTIRSITFRFRSVRGHKRFAFGLTDGAVLGALLSVRFDVSTRLVFEILAQVSSGLRASECSCWHRIGKKQIQVQKQANAFTRQAGLSHDRVGSRSERRIPKDFFAICKATFLFCTLRLTLKTFFETSAKYSPVYSVQTILSLSEHAAAYN